MALDLKAEWAKLNDSISYPQASLVVNGTLAKNKTFIDTLTDVVKANDQWILDNYDKVGELLKDKGSMLTANFTKEMIESCNIKSVLAKDAEIAVNAYLRCLTSIIRRL